MFYCILIQIYIYAKKTKQAELTYYDKLLELGVLWGVSHDTLKQVIEVSYNTKIKKKMEETKKDILRRLFVQNNLVKEDVFKHQHYTIITRAGIDKIQVLIIFK